ncbi:Clp1/GlmU family protein [Pyrobaculum neutrophilum]|uniref:Clp1/GlmU family protein n=1 Tax=Pyrobaculum neutrophilum TaxID=70771 RepID=UPI0011E4E879|nr:Clp1/GlmU family protein [Pyrobaculum neutrophilum]
MFTVEVPEGYSALVRGPAKVRCRGACRVFGGFFQGFEVPPHKQYPVEGPAVFELESGLLALARGSAIPRDWDMELEGVVALVGPPDSGKSSLSTYLLNTHVARGRSVCVVDADVGQSDIGPPGFVAYSYTAAPAPHISELEPHDAYYVGSTNLQGLEELLVAGVVWAVKRCQAHYPHLTVVNTPGWTTGRGIQLLRAVVDAVAPAVVNIGEALLPGRRVSKPAQVLPRGPQERKELRNLSYRRHVKIVDRVEISHDMLTLCTWERGLNCPWGRYLPADVAEPQKRGREYAVPPHHLRHLFAGLYRGGRLAGYAIVEKFEPRPTAYVTATDFDEVRIGKIRLDPHALEELEPLP